MLNHLLNTPAKNVAIALMVLFQMAPISVWAQLPRGGQVVGGQATITQPNPATLLINQRTDRAIINWQSFSIGASNLTRFLQPGSGSVALNRVVGGDLSQIFGQLQANGRIFLLNPNGVIFGPSARVDAAGLLAGTMSIANSDFMAGRYVFQQDPGNLASVINQGVIRTPDGGFVVLAGAGVLNQGTIDARLGTVALASGKTLTIDFGSEGIMQFAVDGALAGQPIGPDGRSLASRVSNEGRISADGGRVTLSARAVGDVLTNVVNNSGIIEARSIANQGGQIVLSGGDSGVVGVSGNLDASGRSAGETGGIVHVLGDKVGLFGNAVIDVSGT